MSELIRSIARKVLPEIIKRKITGLFYGWYGNYDSWPSAQSKSSGYDSADILLKVKTAALEVRNGNAVYERDSVLFYEKQYSYPLLAAITLASVNNKGKVNVLDFGGSFGSTYYQNKPFFSNLNDVNWCIVEQEEFVREGKLSFEDDNLHFFNSIKECFDSYKIDIVIFSSVLQYLEKPFSIIDEIISANPDYLFIDRTPFINGPDRLTVQKVNPWIYKASYPCWFFNKEKFLSAFKGSYELLFEFDALDKANIKSEFKGFLLRNSNPDINR